MSPATEALRKHLQVSRRDYSNTVQCIFQRHSFASTQITVSHFDPARQVHKLVAVFES